MNIFTRNIGFAKSIEQLKENQCFLAPQPPQNRPKTVQDRPKMSQRPPQDAPRAAKERPKTAQDRPKTGQERLKTTQDDPRAIQDQARPSQDRPRAIVPHFLERKQLQEASIKIRQPLARGDPEPPPDPPPCYTIILRIPHTTSIA